MGNRKSKITGGGGRIAIKADSVQFNGAGTKLSADGLPRSGFKGDEPFDKVQGGTGGYIYVHTTNLH